MNRFNDDVHARSGKHHYGLKKWVYSLWAVFGPGLNPEGCTGAGHSDQDTDQFCAEDDWPGCDLQE
jgi:hypothetical protein